LLLLLLLMPLLLLPPQQYPAFIVHIRASAANVPNLQ